MTQIDYYQTEAHCEKSQLLPPEEQIDEDVLIAIDEFHGQDEFLIEDVEPGMVRIGVGGVQMMIKREALLTEFTRWRGAGTAKPKKKKELEED